MSESGLPENVLRLIDTAIGCVAEMETLLLLRECPDTEWTAASLGKRLYLSEAEAQSCLQSLALSQLLSRSGGTGFRYAPQHPELRQAADDLSDSYRTRLIALSTVIHAKRRNATQRFSDAFRLWEQD
jgi:hypothetical protein